MVKVAIVFYSFTGHGTTMAKRLAEKAESLGAEVRLRPVQHEWPEKSNPAAEANRQVIESMTTVSHEDMEWADVVFFGSPSRFSMPSHYLQAFIDTLGPLWASGKLADKVYAAFTSSNTAHGGQETLLQKIYQITMHFGGIIVPPGYTDTVKFQDGNPYGVSHISGTDNLTQVSETTLQALEHMAERAIKVAEKLTK